jgi:hypothetical protein
MNKVQQFYENEKKFGTAIAYGMAVENDNRGYTMGTMIPEYMQHGLALYILFGIRPGAFLSAVLEGDLFGAMAQADGTNAERLPQYCRFLWSYAPSECFKTPERVAAWRDRKGLIGSE